MDLTNKEIDIKYMSSNGITGETIVSLTVVVPITDTITQELGAYTISLIGETYTSVSDAKLLRDLREKLLEIPDPS